MTVQLAVCPLLSVTVMVTVPAPIAVTVPFKTVATLSLDVVQVTVLSVVSSGATVAVKVSLLPLMRERLFLLRLTPDARMLTVTSQVAVLPFAVATVMVTVPAPIAVTVPLLTVATFASDVVQVRLLSVVSSGATVAVKVSLLPLMRERVFLFKLTPDARTLTVTSQVAVLPFAVVTVIVAVPAPTAVTVPFVTIVTFVLEDAQVKVLSVVSAGATVAVKVSLLPLISERLFLFKLTPDASTLTVTSQVAIFPFAVVTVIVAVPAPTAVTVPFTTVATLVLEDTQVKVLSVVSAGVTEAVKVSLLPLMRERLFLLRLTPDARTLTVISQVAVFPFAVVTVMVTVPAPIAVTVPFKTVATLSLDDVQVKVLSVVSSGAMVAVNVSLPPLIKERLFLFRLTPDARTLTVTSQVAVFPFAVVTVIVAVPAPIAVTFPFATVATLVLEDAQVKVLSVASAGATIAVKVSLPPLMRDSVVLFSVTPVARTVVSSLPPPLLFVWLLSSESPSSSGLLSDGLF